MFFKKKTNYEKIFSNANEIYRYIYGDRSKSSEILGSEEFIDAWFSSPNMPMISEVIRSEAMKGDMPSIKQVIWLSDIYCKNVENVTDDKNEQIEIQISALNERIMFCEKAISLGFKDRSYQAMGSCVDLHSLLAARDATTSDESAGKALNGIIKHATLFLSSGNDDPELIEDAENALKHFGPLAELTDGLKARKTSDKKSGQALFEAGMKAALQYRTYEAIDLYTRSFEANPNPSPLINRAKLYRWQLRFDKAIDDLEQASYLDKSQGDEFSVTIANELKLCRDIARRRFDGTREKMIADLRRRGEDAYDEVAERLIDVIFKGNKPFEMFHVMNELDSIKKFERIEDFPEAELFASMIPQSNIDQALQHEEAVQAFCETDLLFKSMICVYDYPDMTKLRCRILYNICYDQPPT